MPNTRSTQTVHIGQTSDIEKMNLSALPRPGELGARVFLKGGKEYKLIQVDSGATASAPTGAVAIGQVAYWKDKTPGVYLVTNDQAQAIGAQAASNVNKRNNAAGIFTAALTAGFYGVIQRSGRMDSVVASGSILSGDPLIADSSATSGAVIHIAAGSAITQETLGVAAGTAAANKVAADLMILDGVD